MTEPGRVLKAWERLWFEEVPPEPFALLRIAFGVLGVIGLIGLTPVSMYWPLDGLTPLPGDGIGIRAQLLSLGLGTVAGWAIFSALLVAFVCMTIGYFTGSAVVACFVGSVLQYHWNHLPLSSALQVQNVVLFCLMWSNCGATLSLDSWLARRRGPGNASHQPAMQPIWPLRLIRVQVTLVYLNSGLWKLFGASWRDGSAIFYALNNNVFHRFPVTIPAGFEWLATISTYVTLFFEIGFVFALFHPWTRRVALVTGLALHLGVWATMEVGPFSWLMMASYVAFLDPHALSRRVRRWLDTRSARPTPRLAMEQGVSSPEATEG